MALQPGTLAPFDTVIDGTLVLAAEPIRDTNLDQWVVQIHFDENGALRLQEFTAEHIGDPLAIVVDSKVISVPTINAEIPGGTAIIQGNFTEQMARELAVQIGSGPLRIDLELLEMF
jgi:preprotein translocase subunit SecD